MFNRTTINLLFSICFGLLLLAADFAIYLLSVVLCILQDIRKWGTLQLRVIAGRLRTCSSRGNSRARHLNGPRGNLNLGLNQDPFADLSPDYFLNQTPPGSPRQSRSRRRARGETTPCRPSSSRPARRPRRLLQARQLSLSPPPTYSEQCQTQGQTMSTVKVDSALTPKVKREEAEQPPQMSHDRPQVELSPGIARLSLAETSATPPNDRLSLVETPVHSTSPTASDNEAAG